MALGLGGWLLTFKKKKTLYILNLQTNVSAVSKNKGFYFEILNRFIIPIHLYFHEHR